MNQKDLPNPVIAYKEALGKTIYDFVHSSLAECFPNEDYAVILTKEQEVNGSWNISIISSDFATNGGKEPTEIGVINGDPDSILTTSYVDTIIINTIATYRKLQIAVAFEKMVDWNYNIYLIHENKVAQYDLSDGIFMPCLVLEDKKEEEA